MTDDELLRERERLIVLYDKARHEGYDIYSTFDEGTADHWPTYKQAFALSSAVLLLAAGSLVIASDAAEGEKAREEIWSNIIRLRVMSEALYGGGEVPQGEITKAQFVVSCFQGDHYHGMIGLDAATCALSSIAVYAMRSHTLQVGDFPAVDSWILAAAGWELLLGWNKMKVEGEEDYWIRPNDDWIGQSRAMRIQRQMGDMGQPPPSMN